MTMISRRRVLQALGLAAVGTPLSTFAQGRCMRTFGSPACNTDPIPPVFAPTGWRTMSLDHVLFDVADYQKEAAFYIALMGWKLRSDDGKQAVMDVGNWGSVIFRQVPADSFPAPAPATGGGGRGRREPVRAAVKSFCFGIEPWNAREIDAQLRKRGLSPVADNDAKGFESFHVSDPDGFDLQIGNLNGLTKARKTPPTAKLKEPLPFQPTGWRTVWLDHFSFGVSNYKKSTSFYTNLLRRGQPERVPDRRRRRHHHPRRQPARAQRGAARVTRRRSHLVRHPAVGHGRRQSGAREARAPRADRHVHRRRHSRCGVQELSHEHAERLQPADQLRHARQSSGAAECGEAEAVGGAVASRYVPGASIVA
jgi:catechol 2,3-dioxygenase-like lactoylglutathione lyase family enzyme